MTNQTNNYLGLMVHKNIHLRSFKLINSLKLSNNTNMTYKFFWSKHTKMIKDVLHCIFKSLSLRTLLSWILII